jgi:hypothetical protein
MTTPMSGVYSIGSARRTCAARIAVAIRAVRGKQFRLENSDMQGLQSNVFEHALEEPQDEPAPGTASSN